MPTLSVQPTYPIFTDIDGQPLEDGYIWIGTANLDPQTNPINVYWDAGLTLLAAQPIRTLAGYPSNSGTPARLYVNSDYSIRVMNKNGSTVYSAPVATERYSAALIGFVGFKGQVGTVQDLADDDGSNWIGFDPASGSGVARSMQDKGRDFVNIKDFGAVGDGITDDTTALSLALAYAHSACGEIYCPAGEYLIGDIDWPGNNITLRGSSSAYSYNSSATPKTKFRAKAGTTTLFDLVQTGGPEDRTGNLIIDIEIDGNDIASYGVNMAGSNVLERCRIINCNVAGVRMTNFTNSSRIVRCGINQNGGWGLLCDGVSTTTYSVTDTNISLNTLGGINIEGGVLCYFQNCVVESNNGPGLRFNKPNVHTNAFEGFLFDNCWFEDNAADAPNYVLVMASETSSPEYGVQRVQFRQCRFTASVATRKYMNVDVAKWVEFEKCQFDNSSQSDAITFGSNAQFVSLINCGEATGSSGLTATQIDNAIAQGSFCWWHDVGIHRNVGAGAPSAAFQNSWVNYDSGFTPARYWFDKDGRVCVEGSVKTGSVGTTVFTLPVGYRPASQKAFACDANGAHSLVYVTAGGEVQVNVGSTSFQSLNGIIFDRT